MPRDFLLLLDVSSRDRGWIISVCVLILLSAGAARAYLHELILADNPSPILLSSLDLCGPSIFGIRWFIGSSKLQLQPKRALSLATVLLISTLCMHISFHSLSFPTATIIQLARPLPEMILTWILFGKLYDVFDVLAFFLILIGMIGIFFADLDSVIPVPLNAVASGVAAVTANVVVVLGIKSARRGQGVPLDEVKILVYGGSALFALVITLFSGQLPSFNLWMLAYALITGVITDVNLFVMSQFDRTIHASLIAPIDLAQNVIGISLSFIIFGHDELTTWEHKKALVMLAFGVLLSFMCQLRINRVFD